VIRLFSSCYAVLSSTERHNATDDAISVQVIDVNELGKHLQEKIAWLMKDELS
jgi:hypothetical protein